MIVSHPLDTSCDLSVDSVVSGQSESLIVGGRISKFLSEWVKIGASRRVLRWIKFGYPLHFKRSLVMSSDLPQLTTYAPPSLITEYKHPAKQQALVSLVEELKLKQCITEMEPSETGYFSRVFLVPKKSGGWRLVIDLSQLNKSLTPVTF